MNAAEATSLPQASPLHPRHLIAGCLLLVMLAAWVVHLFPQWLNNPDLSHGLFTPIVFVLLLHEARTRGTVRNLRPNAANTLLVGVIAAVSLLLLATAGLYAAALEWTHSLVEALLAAALCGFLTAAWIAASLDQVRFLSFNWPAAVSVLVWALSAPIPPGTYTRLTHHLQSVVTGGVLTSLHLLGIAASQDGNVINLAHATVGVEEACSGVRSLLSCIFAGFFLSAVLSRRPWKRAVIVALSAPLAIAMNFFRSLLLTLLANEGIDIRGAWHDVTGFGILVVTAGLLGGGAIFLERIGPRRQRDAQLDGSEKVNTRSPRAPVARPPKATKTGIKTASTMAEWLVVGSLALSIVTLGLFVIGTRASAPREGPGPNLWAMLPETFNGWEVTTRGDLYRFSSQLETDTLAERTYARVDQRGTLQITVYVAYWAAGQASVSSVAAHTPDACWPGSGWVEDRSQHQSIALNIGPVHLPEAQFRSFNLDTFPQQVWYWHLFNGKPIDGAVGSPRQLLSLAWNYGFRDEGEQVFARISSNRSWEEIAHEPLLREIIARLQPLGL